MVDADGDDEMDASGGAGAAGGGGGGGGGGAGDFSIEDVVSAGDANAAALATTPGTVLPTALLPQGSRDLLGTPAAAHSGRGSTASALEAYVEEAMVKCDAKDEEMAHKLDGMNTRLDAMASAIRESSAAQVDIMQQMLAAIRSQQLPEHVAPRIAEARAAEAQFEAAISDRADDAAVEALARRGGSFDDRLTTAARADDAADGGDSDAAGGSTPQ